MVVEDEEGAKYSEMALGGPRYNKAIRTNVRKIRWCADESLAEMVPPAVNADMSKGSWIRCPISNYGLRGILVVFSQLHITSRKELGSSFLVEDCWDI